MSEQVFTATPRSTRAGVSRRGSLATLAMAATIAALGRPAIAEAGKAGKKARKKCKKQVGQCRTVAVQRCSTTSDPQQCEENSLPCCQFLASCNATAFLDCIIIT